MERMIVGEGGGKEVETVYLAIISITNYMVTHLVLQIKSYKYALKYYRNVAQPFESESLLKRLYFKNYIQRPGSNYSIIVIGTQINKYESTDVLKVTVGSNVVE